MYIEVERVEVGVITPLRELYRKEMNCQIISDSFPACGFSDSYLIRMAGEVAGYGLVANKHYPDTVNEFFTFPFYRVHALSLFCQLLKVSRASRIRVQSNSRLMLLLLYDCATDIECDAILFEDAFTSHLPCPGGSLLKITDADRERLEQQKLDTGAEWMIERQGIPVATGGILHHYNPPYGDLYMAVAESARRQGYGSYLVQELKRIAYESGKTPAARCNARNAASRRTLQKAGLLPCGRLLEGAVATREPSFGAVRTP